MRQDLQLTCAGCGHINHLTIFGEKPGFSVCCAQCGTDLKVGGDSSEAM